MNLQDQGFRFILRPKDGRIDGYWEHPSEIKPGGLDVTTFSDDAMLAEIERLQKNPQDWADMWPEAKP